MKEEYQKIKEKYSILPNYEELNKEFNIDEAEKLNLNIIRKKVGEKLEMMLDILERILNPEPASLSDLYECKFVTEKEKQKAFETYKKIMQLYRELLETELSNDEELQTKIIRKISMEMPSLRKEIIPIIKKLKESWKENIEHKEILGYMG